MFSYEGAHTTFTNSFRSNFHQISLWKDAFSVKKAVWNRYEPFDDLGRFSFVYYLLIDLFGFVLLLFLLLRLI